MTNHRCQLLGLGQTQYSIWNPNRATQALVLGTIEFAATGALQANGLVEMAQGSMTQGRRCHTTGGTGSKEKAATKFVTINFVDHQGHKTIDTFPVDGRKAITTHAQSIVNGWGFFLFSTGLGVCVSSHVALFDLLPISIGVHSTIRGFVSIYGVFRNWTSSFHEKFYYPLHQKAA